jgi:hypothetical protein
MERLFEIFATYPHAYTMAELIERMWPDVEREPEWADSVVYVAMHRLRLNFLPAHYPCLRLVHRGGRWRLNLYRGS